MIHVPVRKLLVYWRVVVSSSQTFQRNFSAQVTMAGSLIETTMDTKARRKTAVRPVLF